MNSIRLKARAKINLGLDVTGCRADGYHEVRMVMQSIRLYDRILIRKAGGKHSINIKTNLSYLPVNENNLVYKAVRLMADEFDIQDSVDIELEKFIPVAAGMAGGSADAAAAMIGMTRLFELRVAKEELMRLGVRLGADVPFCIMRGTALAEGIGEILTPLKSAPSMQLVIAKPAVSVSTKYVYDHLVLDEDTVHPDIDSIIRAVAAHDIEDIAGSIGNILENVTVKAYPIIQGIKDTMMENNALNALMSGSGPTVFGIFRDTAGAEGCMEALRKKGEAKQIYLTDVFS